MIWYILLLSGLREQYAHETVWMDSRVAKGDRL